MKNIDIDIDELHIQTDFLLEKINQRLDTLEVDPIGLSDDPVDRAEVFVRMNEWFIHATDHELEDLLVDFGLIPLAFITPNIDSVHAALLQDAPHLDYLGLIRYIDACIMYQTNGRLRSIRHLGKSLFGENFVTTKGSEMRADMVSHLINLFVAAEDSYKAMEALASL